MAAFHDRPHFLKEKRHQQRGDMCAVDIGVGHDDHAVVAQIVRIAILAHPATQRQCKVCDFQIGADFFIGGGRYVQDFTADRQDRLRLAVTRLFGAAARAVAFDDEQFGPRRIV